MFSAVAELIVLMLLHCSFHLPQLLVVPSLAVRVCSVNMKFACTEGLP